ncbi:hypothetical protein [Cellulomonas fengjieae]|uniref:Uncharacterized protein n=1 Tax=Cellulomonas fengjieae TaxID=2819978 RepID=A0ABS3SF48_9CELL|nr:hypothetical protein [Cellulomonas fengjieae]MBO3084119.1 hypothetical protein [Cellulomonas fengjieae]QVI64627.1 hypothetical protein KG102_10560 [Cellulomonas fengjieae]
MGKHVVDLPVDLRSEDDSGLPWGPFRKARDLERRHKGAWIVVGSTRTQAVAQIADIDGGIVRVRPLRRPVSRHIALLAEPA